jgi:hypothetical protein
MSPANPGPLAYPATCLVFPPGIAGKFEQNASFCRMEFDGSVPVLTESGFVKDESI